MLERPVEPRARPMPGTVTTYEVRIRVCTWCGYAMGDGLCSDDCPADGEARTAKDFIEAVYKRTDEFLRDETPARDIDELELPL